MPLTCSTPLMLTFDLGDEVKVAIRLLSDNNLGSSIIMVRLLNVAVTFDSKAGLSFFKKEKDNMLFSPDKTIGVGCISISDFLQFVLIKNKKKE
jgi:hypothetical protein